LIQYAKEALAASPPGSGVYYLCHYHIATAHYQQNQSGAGAGALH
jgi:hypothetical protein